MEKNVSFWKSAFMDPDQRAKRASIIHSPHFLHTLAAEMFWCDIAKYIVKWTQEKWACNSHDGAMPLSFQLQVTEDFLKISQFFHNEKMTSFSRILGKI